VARDEASEAFHDADVCLTGGQKASPRNAASAETGFTYRC
jgi:hypothetical protein